jgi:hypothetical protein
VVEFVLEKLGCLAVEPLLVPDPGEVVPPHHDRGVARQPTERVEETQARIPPGETLVGRPDDLGVHEHPALTEVRHHHPARLADLRGGDRASVARGRAGGPQGVVQVLREAADIGGTWVVDGCGGRSQDRVAELRQHTDRHACAPFTSIRAARRASAAQRPRLPSRTGHRSRT